MKKKLLQHRPTGRIFAWNEDLAKRADMIDYVPQPTAPIEAAPAVATSPDAEDEIKAMARAVLTKKPGK